jgi:ferredoxin
MDASNNDQPFPEGFEHVASVRVDRELCQTAATCLAWHIYELDDEAKAILLTKNGSNSDDPKNVMATPDGDVLVDDLLNPEDKNLTREHMRALVLESAMACPFNAIIVNDADGNQIWPPL